jgi:enoyl reductase
MLLGAVDDPKGSVIEHGRTRGVELRNSKIVISGSGAKGGSGDGYVLKRPCWYEPGMTGAEMLKSQESLRAYWFRYTKNPTEEKFQEFLKQFKDKVKEDGRWWGPAYDAADPKGEACFAGLDPFVFVPPGTTPPAGITIQELAEIARAALTVPKPTVRLSPDAKSFVNLPTWVWLEGVGETRRSVTAEIPGVMSVTVVATLENIKIDPGTTKDRAEVHEEGCGTSGKRYAKGAAFTCGVRYLRASIDQPRETYTLTVTTSWPVRAEGGVVPFQFAPVEVGATRDVPVGEIQSNVKP